MTFRIKTEYRGEFYCIYEFVLGETLGTLGKKYITSDVYNERMNTKGHPIQLNKYNSQFAEKEEQK